MKQVGDLVSHVKHDKIPKDFQNPHKAEYTKQLRRTAKATIVSAGTVIESQSTIVGRTDQQYPASFNSNALSVELRKHKIEEWISHTTTNREELGSEPDNVSELMPYDSVSCTGLDTNKQSEQMDGLGTRDPPLWTNEPADSRTNMTADKGYPVENTFDERRAHLDPIVANDALLELAKRDVEQGLKRSSNIKETMLYLLGMGADVNVKDAKSKTPLHHSCFRGNTVVVELLLEHNANCNITDEEASTPLHVAAVKGHVEVLKTLLEAGALLNAKASGHDWTPLHCASANGHVEIVERLLRAGASLNARTADSDWTPLHLASDSGQIEVVKALLKFGSSVNAKGDRNNPTPSYIASSEGYVEIVETLLEAGASVNAVNYFEETPLHVASRKGNLEVVKTLLKAGASPESKCIAGWTSLMNSARWGHKKIIELLLTAGADSRARDYGGFTALHLVFFEHSKYYCKEAKCGFCSGSCTRKEIIELLCENGASPSAKADYGSTPLLMIRSCGYFTKSEQKDLSRVLRRYRDN